MRPSHRTRILLEPPARVGLAYRPYKGLFVPDEAANDEKTVLNAEAMSCQFVGAGEVSRTPLNHLTKMGPSHEDYTGKSIQRPN